MGSLIDQSLNEVEALRVLPEDNYQLKIVSMSLKRGENRDGNSWTALNIMLVPVEYDDTDYVYHMLFFPRQDDDRRDKQKAYTRLANFCKTFSIDTSEFQSAVEEAEKMEFGNRDPFVQFEDAVGVVNLTVRKRDDGEKTNSIGAFIVPGGGAQTGKARKASVSLETPVIEDEEDDY